MLTSKFGYPASVRYTSHFLHSVQIAEVLL